MINHLKSETRNTLDTIEPSVQPLSSFKKQKLYVQLNFV